MAEIIKLGSNGNWGVKPNGVLAYNDEDNVFKAIELQSSRASGATYVGEDGLIKDAEVGVPRIDWTNGVGELLLEPQRRNLITYSEDFTDASWVKANTTINANAVLSPDGSVNASKLIASATSTSHYLRRNVTSVSDATLSFFVKKAEEDTIFIGNATASQGAEFDLTNGVVNSVTGGSADIVDYGNGWYRCSYTRTSFTDWQYLSLRGNFTSYLGDGASGVYVWGAQLEDNGTLGGGDYMTSYIRNDGNVAGVTRIADAVSGNSSLGQVINSSEGVLYFEGSALYDDAVFRSLSISDGSNQVVVELRYRTTNRINFIIRDDVNPDINNSYTISDITDNSKFAVKYKSGDIAFWINGAEVFAGTSSLSLSGLDTLNFNNGAGGSNPFYGRVRELKVYDTALTDAELTALTTL